jgi:hypothetical protein
MKNFAFRLLLVAGFALSLTSCSLLTAPLRLLGRAANSILSPVGGVGGAARLAPLLLDAKDGQRKPVRGVNQKLKLDSPPSQRTEPRQELVRRSGNHQKATGAEG